jgi:hypothetical protein
MANPIKALKYISVLPERKKEIAMIYKDHRVSEYIEELYTLIEYQMKMINEQRAAIVAERHNDAWKQYYKALELYDEQSRRYFTKEELESRKC